MSWWPFVSRAHYDYMRTKLEADVERERANFKRTLDYILERSAGARLFEEVTKPVQNDQPSGFMRIVESPQHRSARARVRQIQEDVNAQYAEAQAVIDKTVEEGEQAATRQ